MASNIVTGAASSNSGGDGDKGLEKKKNLMTDKLLKMEEDRQDIIQKRLDEKEKVTALDESSQLFTVNFARESNQIEFNLRQCESVPKSELLSYFDRMSVSLQNLQKFLADATMYLPARNVLQSQKITARLQTDIQNKRDQLLPKKKFAFKSKKKTVDKPDGGESAQTELTQTNGKTLTDNSAELADCKFVDRDGEKLEMTGDEIKFKDLALARLKNCTVVLRGSPSAIHVRGLKDCRVFCGPVGGSIFITDCSSCVFVLPCQQLRIHTTTDTKFYIHVTCRAIIEDTSGVGFAPYNWNYDGIDEHYRISGLDKARNNWDDVDDFNWLASDKRSPNWSVISDENRVKTWNI